MARPKKANGTLRSIDECTEAMRKLLVATVDLEAIIAERDRAVAALMKEYERQIARLSDTADDLKLQLQNYYMAHLADVERDGRRSIELQYGVMGRRLGNPVLRLLNRTWTWAAVMARLAEVYGTRFLRLKDPELNKDAVKEHIPEDMLREFGLKLEQEERFYVELSRPHQEVG